MVTSFIGFLRLSCLALLLTASLLAAEQAVGPYRTVDEAESDEFTPAVAYNPDRDEYFVVFHDYRQSPPEGEAQRVVRAVRLNRYGQAIEHTSMMHPIDVHDRSQVSVAYDPDHRRYFIAYIYDFPGDGSDYDVRGRFIDAEALVLLGDELVLASTGVDEFKPKSALSTVADRLLVTWWRDVDPPGFDSVQGCLVSSVDFGVGPEFLIADHPGENRLDPDLAWNPWRDQVAVAYSNAVDIFVRLVTMSSGAVGDEIGVAAWPDTEASPAIASCWADQFLLAWHSSPNGNDLYARFLTGPGDVDGPPLLLSSTPLAEQYADIDCLASGTDYLVVFEVEHSGGAFGTSGLRVSTLKQIAPEFTLWPSYTDSTRPAVAGSSEGWFTVWELDRPQSIYWGIHGRIAWDLFCDGFEDSLTTWSASVP